jgi:hypothetical protein
MESRRKSDSMFLEMDPLLRDFCSPTMLLRPSSSSPAAPPGFDGSPSSGTPPFVPTGSAARSPTAASVEPSQMFKSLEPLFAPVVQPLLPRPSSSTPPRRPKNRRKTLAIHHTGFTARRSSSRIKERRRARPIAKEAEALVCRNLGITLDGEVVTEQALDVFADMFKEEVSADAIRALRVLFKLDAAQDIAVEEAMLARGGAAALEQMLDDAV